MKRNVAAGPVFTNCEAVYIQNEFCIWKTECLGCSVKSVYFFQACLNKAL